MIEDLHKAHLNKQRAAFKDAPHNRSTDPIILDEQNMFRVYKGNSYLLGSETIALREKVRMLNHVGLKKFDDSTSFSIRFYKDDGFSLMHPDMIGRSSLRSTLGKNETGIEAQIPVSNNLELYFYYALQEGPSAILENLWIVDDEKLTSDKLEREWYEDDLEIHFNTKTGEAVLNGRRKQDLIEPDLPLEAGKEYSIERNGKK